MASTTITTQIIVPTKVKIKLNMVKVSCAKIRLWRKTSRINSWMRWKENVNFCPVLLDKFLTALSWLSPFAIIERIRLSIRYYYIYCTSASFDWLMAHNYLLRQIKVFHFLRNAESIILLLPTELSWAAYNVVSAQCQTCDKFLSSSMGRYLLRASSRWVF